MSGDRLDTIKRDITNISKKIEEVKEQDYWEKLLLQNLSGGHAANCRKITGRLPGTLSLSERNLQN
jgi:hypothetical protein